MGRKCCVPMCNSNYGTDGDYTPSFQFPPDRKEIWLRAINRGGDFQPSKTAVVCIKHFEEKYIIREDRVTRPDGSLLVVARKKLALTADAIPTIFMNQPKYLTKTPTARRNTPDDRRNKIEQRDDELFSLWLKNDQIDSYDCFLKLFKEKLGNNWQSLKCDGFVLFYIIDVNELPRISVSLKVFEDLKVKVFSKDLEGKSFTWLLGKDAKCDKWSIFDNLLSLLTNPKAAEFSPCEKLSTVVQLLNEVLTETEDLEKAAKFEFLKSQLELCFMKQPRYTPQVFLWSARLFFAYPAAYYCLRNSKLLTLPHPSYLRKLSQIMKTGVSSDHFSFLKKKAELLNENEKVVNLLLDEIYVDKCIDFKRGTLYGPSLNSDSLASTVQSFMITSVFSKNKDIVALFPVHNMCADDLYSFCLKVLEMLHLCGYIVVSMISDNNRLNGKMFSLLCGGTLQCSINNPFSPDQKIFLLFDSVHLLKSIRNNWLNQIATRETLFFPHPETNEILRAELSNLKDIYEEEKNQIVKTAHKLSLKVLYPTSLERQNVSYATSLFHESNYVALEQKKTEIPGVLGTMCFLEQVIKWWTVINVKSPTKGTNKRNALSEPIYSVNSAGVEFLRKFSSWMADILNLRLLLPNEKKRISVPTKGGLLSKETASALKFTTDSILLLIDYLFETYHVEYVLLGKFQTDPIEARFGQYRQMSGGKYQVSCTQILESEKKLKILSLINVYSEKKGEFRITDLKFDDDFGGDIVVPEGFYDLFSSHDDIDISESTMGVLVYIAGYVGHKLCQKLTCSYCKQNLIKDKPLELDCDSSDIFFSYLKLTSRGGLKYPLPKLIRCAVFTYTIFVKILRKHESEFLKVTHPKQLLVKLGLEKTECMNLNLEDTEYIWSNCQNGCDANKLMKQCISALSNIFLNNYTKVKNDEISSNKGKRKFSTLIH